MYIIIIIIIINIIIIIIIIIIIYIYTLIHSPRMGGYKQSVRVNHGIGRPQEPGDVFWPPPHAEMS